MNILLALLYRDLCEFWNRKRRLYPLVVAPLFPLLACLSKTGLLASRADIMRLMYLIIPIYISLETTLSQTVRYLSSGIYERYLINKYIPKACIVLEKWILTAAFSTIALVLSMIVKHILIHFGVIQALSVFNGWIFLDMLIVGLISASLGLVSAVIIRSEKNMYLYVAALLVVMVAAFLLFQLLGFYSELALTVYLVVVAAGSLAVSRRFFTSARFINRDAG